MCQDCLCQEHFKFDHMVLEIKIAVDITENKPQIFDQKGISSDAPRRGITFFKQITLSDKI